MALDMNMYTHTSTLWAFVNDLVIKVSLVFLGENCVETLPKLPAYLGSQGLKAVSKAAT